MDVQKEIVRLRENIARDQANIQWLEKHRAKLEAAPEGSFFGDQLDFDRKPHKEVIQAIRAIGGKWKKSPNGGEANTIDYETEFEGKRVRCWAGKPPPSCRLVEVEELIPAQPARVVKRMKMVCKPDLAAEIAVARQPDPTQPAA